MLGSKHKTKNMTAVHESITQLPNDVLPEVPDDLSRLHGDTLLPEPEAGRSMDEPLSHHAQVIGKLSMSGELHASEPLEATAEESTHYSPRAFGRIVGSLIDTKDIESEASEKTIMERLNPPEEIAGPTTEPSAEEHAPEWPKFDPDSMPAPTDSRPSQSPNKQSFDVPAEQAREGLSAEELNRLLDSDDPADRDRALAEARIQNQNDGTRIMPENLKDFTASDVNGMSEQQLFSITPKQARQMNRKARRSLKFWQDTYRQEQQHIAMMPQEKFNFMVDHIDDIYEGLTEGAKGVYQMRLIHDAAPADLARINPNSLTVPNAKELYAHRRRMLEEQGYQF